uniref:Cytochrome P450 72A68-like n=2 Tax=Cicer arietinum TaxID=3827 RepID=A0A3Q7YGW1_CICAR|nr:cytochrome P450 72A68-like [Cicer arietinum]
MEVPWAIIVSIILLIILVWAWKAFNWLWLKPKKLERILREQGLKGTSYRLLYGDTNDVIKMQTEAAFKSINLSDDLVSHVFPYDHQTVTKYGNNPFIWFGPKPRVILTDSELVKEVFMKSNSFQKLPQNPLLRMLINGLVSYDSEKWSKHRKIINPAFHLEKLKLMLPTFLQCCDDLVSNWEGELSSSNGTCEVDVWPSVQKLSSDVIARTAFGSTYEEGIKIFELLKEQMDLTAEMFITIYIPGWRFLPTAKNRRVKEIYRDLKALLTKVINNREKALKAGESPKNDLLGILLESNRKEIEDKGMNLEDVIKECKGFYLAGQETTSVSLIWALILLSKNLDWQERAREEVLQVFGNRKPDFEGLNQLKIVTMIMYEVLRLYTPIFALPREVYQDVKIGNLTIPAGAQIILPIIMIHYDQKLWGDDVKEFNPGRFSEGILKATNGKAAYFPFGMGPRICIGQNYSLIEAKLALAMILQRFSFELSPAYTHSPAPKITLYPQHGAHLILHKINP